MNSRPIPPTFPRRQPQGQGCSVTRSALGTLSSGPKARSSGSTKGILSKWSSILAYNIIHRSFVHRTYTFWRFTLAVELQENEMAVSYSVNNGQSIDFFVPGRSQNFRWATHSVSDLQSGTDVLPRSDCCLIIVQRILSWSQPRPVQSPRLPVRIRPGVDGLALPSRPRTIPRSSRWR